MFVGDILVAQNLVTREDVADGLAVQRFKGGSLGDSLVELGRISPEVLAAAVQAVPASPHTVADTGLSLSLLLNLMMKAMHVVGVDTPSAIGELLKLPPRAVQELLDEAGERKLINVLGAVGAGLAAERCYSVSMAGAEWALAAMRQCKYIGPAPVTLAAFREQIRRQGVSKVKINHGAIDRAFGDMVISEELVCKIGPAINSARSILLYGPPGNGKSSIATRIGSLFKDVIYVPYCFEVDGQIITVFDPTVHQSVQETQDAPADDPVLRREDFAGRPARAR
jgi:predicted ATPase with chaperone activity